MTTFMESVVLVDLKRHLGGYGDHLEMAGEVLETLIHQHDVLVPVG
jgi:hypothetical protein